MTTSLFTHPSCFLHDNGPGHPENPERLRAILSELEKPAFRGLRHEEAPRATLDQIARVHDRPYMEALLARIPKEGRVALDHETSLNPHSGIAALHAAGAVIAAIDAVMKGNTINAFCAVRPPGHHAATPPASGFCLFNNLAIGAAHALAVHDLTRIAIVDFDVHHGNGTQAWAETKEEILFFSSHQFPLWPGSGLAEDKGQNGQIVNIPLPPGAGGILFREAMKTEVLPALEKFKPELILISAGFDAHKDDPLANLALTEEDFGWITEALCTVAKTSGFGRVVSTLEGGYDPRALAKSAGAHVKALMAAGNLA